MKKAIIIFAWVSIIGSIGDGLIAIYCILLSVFQSSVEFNITVDQLLKDHIYFLYWAKQVAYLVMPHSFVNWLFGLPALVYFPIRVVTSVLIGWWVLRIAKKI